MKISCSGHVALGLLVIAVGLLAGAVAAQAAPWTASSNQPAVVIELKGKVEVLGRDDANWRPVNQRERLQPGTKLRTGKDSRALLELSNRNRLLISAETEITYEAGSVRNEPQGASGGPGIFANRPVKQYRVSQNSGRVVAILRGLGKGSTFELKTPVAVAAVRGTYFVSLMTAFDAVTFSVLEGALSVSAATLPQAATVKAGEMLSVSRAAAGEVRQIPAATGGRLREEQEALGEKAAEAMSTAGNENIPVVGSEGGSSSGGAYP